MGLIVVLSEEEEEEQQMEEDKEVQRIFEKGKGIKRKILKGMSIMSDKIRILVHVLTIHTQINVKLVKLNVFLLL